MSKKDKILKLARLLKMDDNTIQYYSHLLKAVSTEISPAQYERIETFFKNEFVPVVLEDIYNAMDEIVDEDYLDKVITFQESELGQKIQEVAVKLEEKVKEFGGGKWDKMLQELFVKLGVHTVDVDE